MYINKVISYKNAWNEVTANYEKELYEALSSLNEYFNDLPGKLAESAKSDSPGGRLTFRDIWDRLLYEKGWEIIDRVHYSTEGVRINVGRMGPIKNGMSASLPFGAIDNVSRWVFQQSTIAMKYGLIKIPLLLIPTRDLPRDTDNFMVRRENFEMNLEQLEALTPLSHQYPFLIVGYSNKEPVSDPKIIELASDSYVKSDSPAIDRCIEFPPEYHQAGLGILNYFGTYLREQYPAENAAVKIEQEGLNVRLIIETADGRSEVVEKALHEYELIISGAEPPEKFSSNDKLIIELRNELRIAKFRLESQQDMIGMQNNKIDQLLNIVSVGLAQKNQMMVDFKPTITISNRVVVNQEVTAAVNNINELMESLPESNDAYFALKELEGSLISIETENNQESVRRSPAMSKFKRFIEKAIENGTTLNSALKKTEQGWEVFSELAGRYNKLAEWCGLPVVPSFLLK
ncbi:hypothetical protein QMZ93_09235 [Pantoea stewartii subsp. indologenes]|uniref:hypothetical protein n=1 Tax=Pantoea stewartii TaxID=66269 RepID=UPI00197D1B63|nr:hypothetical protein [Pantoea stewartii]MDK2633516.1 hypothetical protein [Pantoea stewartii subsp. indologenes]